MTARRIFGKMNYLSCLTGKKNKVIYQIFPSRFATDKDVPEDVWYQAPIGHKEELKGSLRIEELNVFCRLMKGFAGCYRG